MLIKQDAPPIDLFKKREIIDVEPGGVTMTVTEVLAALNRRLFQEGTGEQFTFGGPHSQAGSIWMSNHPTSPLRPRVLCSPMRGASEAYWVDLWIIYYKAGGSTEGFLLASHKAWSWQEAVEIAALTLQLLDVTD